MVAPFIKRRRRQATQKAAAPAERPALVEQTAPTPKRAPEPEPKKKALKTSKKASKKSASKE